MMDYCTTLGFERERTLCVFLFFTCGKCVFRWVWCGDDIVKVISVMRPWKAHRDAACRFACCGVISLLGTHQDDRQTNP